MLELTTFAQLMSKKYAFRELRFDYRSEALACAAISCLSAPSEKSGVLANLNFTEEKENTKMKGYDTQS
jgi:hypothetical protein